MVIYHLSLAAIPGRTFRNCRANHRRPSDEIRHHARQAGRPGDRRGLAYRFTRRVAHPSRKFTCIAICPNTFIPIAASIAHAAGALAEGDQHARLEETIRHWFALFERFAMPRVPCISVSGWRVARRFRTASMAAGGVGPAPCLLHGRALPSDAGVPGPKCFTWTPTSATNISTKGTSTATGNALCVCSPSAKSASRPRCGSSPPRNVPGPSISSPSSPCMGRRSCNALASSSACASSSNCSTSSSTNRSACTRKNAPRTSG